MNRILSLIGVVLVVGCSEPIPRNVEELMIHGPTLVDPETLEPYSGPVFELSVTNSSEITTRYNLKDGRYEGPIEYYHDNGQVSQRTGYKDGVQVGPRERYYDNGRLLSKGTYKDGGYEGPYEWYDVNGRVNQKGIYKEGEPCGEWLEYGETVTYDPC